MEYLAAEGSYDAALEMAITADEEAKLRAAKERGAKQAAAE